MCSASTTSELCALLQLQLFPSVFSSQIAATNSTKDKLMSSACVIAHPDKQGRCEDAYFITSNALGIADGVGGWAQLGIDSGVFARALMTSCRDCLSNEMDELAKENTTMAELLRQVLSSTNQCNTFPSSQLINL